jgi:hypothetical protein
MTMAAHVPPYSHGPDAVRACGSEGLEFPDKAAAWHEASVSCGEIIREMEPGSHWQMEVSDASGKPIYQFTFAAEEV